ncbi:co-chaperone DjlA [Thiohalocapsa marina]|uniref:Co-chaperone protein DjlA n=1 Tax=Thiohalocapsa marina TaxID=424902 RepID=A0A5M8FQD5_9GAMM|nr:co-chaperone DjlA [Thiohalocapsa marina]KAA6185411.1 co-chaperone DjlA [Thiohalocapsa marina]
MGWIGKVVGGLLGFAAGGPIGAMLGATLGHGVDRGVQKLADDMQLPPGDRQRIESVFFAATFSTMGHLAKADGRVSEAEIALAEAVMARLQLTGERRSAAIALFRQGKSPEFDLRAVVERFRRECLGRRTLVQLFLEIQLQAAYVDGEPSAAKRRVLEEIRAGLHIPAVVFRQLENLVRMQSQFAGAGGAGADAGYGAGAHGQRGAGGARAAARGPTLSQAYAVLGVTPKDTDATVKRAYRKLLSQHHPDKLVSKGVPEDMIKLATQKTHEIRRAYEMIQQARSG